jgi:CO dehydrogenase maturation factor
MRISFLGKGGSGKTTVSAAFIKYLKNTQDQANILAIDADVNVHLGALLGIESQSISGRKDDIKEYFEGSDHPVIGVSPPSRDSKFVTIDPNDQFLQE